MTEDEQSGTLAFLQNFYTGVTLYMPAEADERPAPAASPAPEAVAPAAVVAAPPAPTGPVAGAPPIAGAPAPAAPAIAAPIAAPAAMPSSPIAAPVSAAAKLPSLASAQLPPLPAPPPPVASPPPLAPPSAPAAAPTVAPYLLTTFATLGNNPQGVVLLVRLPPEQFKKLPRNVFLNKLLQAIQLVMADVVLVNVEGPYPVALQNLRKEIAATHILAFGKNLLDVAVRTTQIYEPVQFPAVGLAYLAGAEVEMIEYDVSLKKRLWGGLQRMFLA
ncbi:hypothetical protein [Hymenobacter cheonanensis]|uniref:hypothetical protein n=1 Tax=Hymenobacter sp. CA2-7 TaxID=3063993 RepID=UPI0027123F57|nr:hypothetical protein [Hymenobacter sp. CA2-7]MDO7886233.1 hypothetical protein [Hymenobacter sp. CA2-7]